MMTFRQLALRPETIPAAIAWSLADVAEAHGKQELFTRQSPQILKVLREHAMIESAVSSNRIEGVEVDEKRVATIVFGKPPLKDRDEEELKGYRDALNLIHEQGGNLSISEETILRLHRLCKAGMWDAGHYKEKDGDILEKYADGRERVRFRTVPAAETPESMRLLIDKWRQCLDEQWVHPLIALSAFNLDFLCIHPFRDGNGRLSRLLLLQQCYHLGYEVGRYISIERLIEENKERYYETLEQSSQGWHDAKHDPWPYVNYILYILKRAHRELEQRVGQMQSPRGAKTGLVESAIKRLSEVFTLTDIEQACPGVSRDMIRKILRGLQASGEVECVGRGPGARWKKRGTILKRG